MIVPSTEEARARFRQLSIELTEEFRAAAGSAFTAILARIGENALKLALIVAVGRYRPMRRPSKPEPSGGSRTNTTWRRHRVMWGNRGED